MHHHTMDRERALTGHAGLTGLYIERAAPHPEQSHARGTLLLSWSVDRLYIYNLSTLRLTSSWSVDEG